MLGITGRYLGTIFIGAKWEDVRDVISRYVKRTSPGCDVINRKISSITPEESSLLYKGAIRWTQMMTIAMTLADIWQSATRTDSSIQYSRGATVPDVIYDLQ